MRITKIALVVACSLLSLTAKAGTPLSFEYSWDGFTNTATGKYKGKSFYRRQYYTPTSNTGANGGAESTQWFISLETSSGSAFEQGDYAELESSSITAKTMSFYYHMYGADIGTLAVEVYNGYTWVRTWELTGEQQLSSNDEWRKITLDLSSYPISKKIRFKAIAAGGAYGDIGIDHVTFFDAPAAYTEYKYDVLGRLICTLDSADGDTSYEYDNAGNRTQVTEGVCNE